MSKKDSYVEMLIHNEKKHLVIGIPTDDGGRRRVRIMLDRIPSDNVIMLHKFLGEYLKELENEQQKIDSDNN